MLLVVIDDKDFCHPRIITLTCPGAPAIAATDTFGNNLKLIRDPCRLALCETLSSIFNPQLRDYCEYFEKLCNCMQHARSRGVRFFFEQ